MPYKDPKDRIKCVYRWREANPEKFVSSTKKFYNNHKAEIQDQQKRYRQNKKEDRIHRMLERSMDRRDGFTEKKPDPHSPEYYKRRAQKRKESGYYKTKKYREANRKRSRKRYWKKKITVEATAS